MFGLGGANCPRAEIRRQGSDLRRLENDSKSSNKLNSYPLLSIKDLYAKLSSVEKFTTLDLMHAYYQVNLEEMSREMPTINAHQGRNMYKRLPFGGGL